MTLVPRPKVEETLETINLEGLLSIACISQHIITTKIPGIDEDVILGFGSFRHVLEKITNKSEMPKYAVINRNVDGHDTVIRIRFIGSAVECSHYCSSLED